MHACVPTIIIFMDTDSVNVTSRYEHSLCGPIGGQRVYNLIKHSIQAFLGIAQLLHLARPSCVYSKMSHLINRFFYMLQSEITVPPSLTAQLCTYTIFSALRTLDKTFHATVCCLRLPHRTDLSLHCFVVRVYVLWLT